MVKSARFNKEFLLLFDDIDSSFMEGCAPPPEGEIVRPVDVKMFVDVSVSSKNRGNPVFPKQGTEAPDESGYAVFSERIDRVMQDYEDWRIGRDLGEIVL